MKSFLLGFCLFLAVASKAQILKTNMVEHFTNSNCSICASKNPGIFSDLSTHPNTLHIAFHPSSPYASCFFSMQNPVENDARTNYYGIFGGTPKLIVNGNLVTTANLASSLNSIDLDSSNYSIQTTQEFILADSVVVKIIIKKVGLDTTQQASLFVGAAEDTVFQTTGNGESLHHDVFRKSLSLISGDLLTLPQMVGDSVEAMYSYKIPANWNAQRMNSIVILQSLNTKFVLNSSKSKNITSVPNTLQYLYNSEGLIYPNPASDLVYFKNIQIDEVEIVNMQGKSFFKQTSPNSFIRINELPNGLYLIKIKQDNTMKISKLSVQR